MDMRGAPLSYVFEITVTAIGRLVKVNVEVEKIHNASTLVSFFQPGVRHETRTCGFPLV